MARPAGLEPATRGLEGRRSFPAELRAHEVFMDCKRCEVTLTKENTYTKGPKRPNDFQSYCKSCFNRYCAERWRQKKLDAIAYKGGACAKCKGHFHYSVFDFHHLDPRDKDVNWTKLRLRSEAKIKAELDKCELLCSNCHRLTHWMISEEDSTSHTISQDGNGSCLD